LAVRAQQSPLPDRVQQSLSAFQRAANYIAAGTDP
jgi:hypothetical protein